MGAGTKLYIMLMPLYCRVPMPRSCPGADLCHRLLLSSPAVCHVLVNRRQAAAVILHLCLLNVSPPTPRSERSAET